MTVQLTAVGTSLVMGPTTLTNAKAVPLALLWSERVCLTAGLQLGSEAYFQCLTNEMGRIAWNVTDAGVTTYDQSSGSVTPADAVVQLAGRYLPADQQRSLKVVFDAIGAASPEPALDSLLTTFWANQRQNVTGTCFSAAPVSLDANGQLTTTLSYLAFDGSAERWQSFFLGRMSAQTRLLSRHVRLTLNAGLWAEIDDQIAEKLGQAAIASIQHIDI